MRLRFLPFLLVILLIPAFCSAENVILPDCDMPEYVTWLLETAQSELGYTEEKNGISKYGTWSGNPYAEWCAEFLCWCVNQVDIAHGTHLLGSVYPLYTGTNTGRDWFLEEGRYISRKGTVPEWGSQWYKGSAEKMAKNSYVPMPGDWVFFSTGSLGNTTHVAMVEYCTEEDDGSIQIHVIEGNNPASVARNQYPIDYWAILGYGTVYDQADIVLRFGNSGKKVIALQNKLILLGLMEPQYNTGKYGAITTQAVKDFQSSAALSPTGIANHETQMLLDDAVADMYRNNPSLWQVQDID